MSWVNLASLPTQIREAKRINSAGVTVVSRVNPPQPRHCVNALIDYIIVIYVDDGEVT